MEKKAFIWTLLGGFVAGLVTMFVVCSLFAPQHRLSTFFTPERGYSSVANLGQHRLDMQHRPHHTGKFSQHRRHFEPTPEMKARFAEKLGLSDEQKQQLDQFREEDMAKMKPLFEQMEALRTQISALRQQGRQHFESVLTDEQKVILQKMKKHRQNH